MNKQTFYINDCNQMLIGKSLFDTFHHDKFGDVNVVLLDKKSVGFKAADIARIYNIDDNVKYGNGIMLTMYGIEKLFSEYNLNDHAKKELLNWLQSIEESYKRNN